MWSIKVNRAPPPTLSFLYENAEKISTDRGGWRGLLWQWSCLLDKSGDSFITLHGVE